ncbi:MAG: GTP pyrophosphokinase family protein [Lachnospiraceae bacterium]|nr:GTP pyrophosphokinase family protein [Lachnospiraceae bacterium]
MVEELSLEQIVENHMHEDLMAQSQPFIRLMNQYRSAIMEMETKLKILDAEFSMEYDRNPFESIKSRLKSPVSIFKKLEKKGLPVTVESMERYLFDIAGLRVICSFEEDIYKLMELLLRQDDIRLIRKKDYIGRPKPNGYRSLHLILEVPVFQAGGPKKIKVEVQFRTIAMDFWASLEHKLRYKKNIAHSEEIAEELRVCAEKIAQLDQQMQEIRHRIDRDSGEEY